MRGFRGLIRQFRGLIKGLRVLIWRFRGYFRFFNVVEIKGDRE